MYEASISFIRSIYTNKEFVALHEPKFFGNEKRYLNTCIDSTFVSSVGAFVDRFESMVAEFTGMQYAIATVNGTAALHIALKLAGVEEGNEVITQPLTFVATCNAISYCGASPLFVDVDRETMGLSPESLRTFLDAHAYTAAGVCYNKTSGKRIAAVVPMHTFGHPCKIDEIGQICSEYGIALVEDAAESLGSFYKRQHTGSFGIAGVFSFNGNKTITTGGGGMIVTNDENFAKHAKHITTTAKVGHPYEYVHDEIGYNYRMPNLNAALGCAQMEVLSEILKQKRELALRYADFFNTQNVKFISEPESARSNYWLNTILLDNQEQRDLFLKETNEHGIMTRPVWRLMPRLEMFKNAQCANLDNALWLERRIVNLPSGIV